MTKNILGCVLYIISLLIPLSLADSQIYVLWPYITAFILVPLVMTIINTYYLIKLTKNKIVIKKYNLDIKYRKFDFLAYLLLVIMIVMTFSLFFSLFFKILYAYVESNYLTPAIIFTFLATFSGLPLYGISDLEIARDIVKELDTIKQKYIQKIEIIENDLSNMFIIVNHYNVLLIVLNNIIIKLKNDENHFIYYKDIEVKAKFVGDYQKLNNLNLSDLTIDDFKIIEMMAV